MEIVNIHDLLGESFHVHRSTGIMDIGKARVQTDGIHFMGGPYAGEIFPIEKFRETFKDASFHDENQEYFEIEWDKQEEPPSDDLKPGDLVSFTLTGRIETVSERGYVVFTHGVQIPILKSSIKEVFKPAQAQKTP